MSMRFIFIDAKVQKESLDHYGVQASSSFMKGVEAWLILGWDSLRVNCEPALKHNGCYSQGAQVACLVTVSPSSSESAALLPCGRNFSNCSAFETETYRHKQIFPMAADGSL